MVVCVFSGLGSNIGKAGPLFKSAEGRISQNLSLLVTIFAKSICTRPIAGRMGRRAGLAVDLRRLPKGTAGLDAGLCLRQADIVQRGGRQAAQGAPAAARVDPVQDDVQPEPRAARGWAGVRRGAGLGCKIGHVFAFRDVLGSVHLLC